MSDVKLFRITNGNAEELVGQPVKLEKKLQSLGEKHLDAFLHVQLVATVQLQTQKNSLLMWLPLDPDTVTLEDGFSTDKRNVGHHGTGDLELLIRSLDDLEKAKPLIQKSFEEN